MSPADKKRAVREPVQVYLTQVDRKLLREVAEAAGISGAEVLRRGLRRMAGEILSERSAPMRLLDEMNAAEWAEDTPPDAGRRHDVYLAESNRPAPRKRRRRE